MKNTTLGLITAASLAWCAHLPTAIDWNHDTSSTIEDTRENISGILSETTVMINGVPFTLELYPTNIEFAINDDDCSIDPATSFEDEIPVGYDEDTVTACLYAQ